MDDLVRLLSDTQRAEAGPRKQAERGLRRAQASPAFPRLLTAIAATARYPTEIRQAALSVLRQFVVRNWADVEAEEEEEEEDEEEEEEAAPRVPIADDVKQALRGELLALATRDDEADRRVQAAVSYVVGKIAAADYPARWPDLLDTLLGVVRAGGSAAGSNGLHGALRVLGDLVEDGLSEAQFFAAARGIVEALYQVAVVQGPGHRALLRALAVSVFRSSFDLMDMVKEEHLREVKAFAQEALAGWLPFFHEVLQEALPGGDGASAAAAAASADGQQAGAWNGVVALKLQCVKTLLKIKAVFSSLLLPQSPALFRETWHELARLQGAYAALYLDHDSQSRLEDADGLPYTLDFLVLEELDLLNQCIRAPPVQKELGGAGADPAWLAELVALLVGYARVTREQEDLWDIDVSLYLAEETSVTANYTARTACGDLLIKLGEWLGGAALEALYSHTEGLFGGAAGNGGSDWRAQEAALYLFTMLAGDLLDCGQTLPAGLCDAYLALVDRAVGPAAADAAADADAAAAAAAAAPLLQARGLLAAGLLAETHPAATRFLDRALHAVTGAPSSLVQVAAVKALDGFLKGGAAVADAQVPVLRALHAFLHARDPDDLEDADDLLATLCETLRRAIALNPAVVVAAEDGGGVPSCVDLLFALARCGARNFQVTMLVNETFEEAVRGLGGDAAAYAALCGRAVPALGRFFALSSLAQDELLVTMATELLAVLAQNGTEPLPAGLVAQVAPTLQRLLLASDEGAVLRPGAEALKYLLVHDHPQVFAWHDAQGHSGLVVCLQIVDRLLGPAVEDNAASEVGGLAAELVDKAGPQRLGDGLLPRLLQAVALRLASAQTAPFVQSLILVFARLCLTAAGEVVAFLSQIAVGPDNGLAVVLAKWLENSMNFAGYDEIRQNVIALSKLYDLDDPRIAQTLVQGDLIVPASDRIMTRSRAKQNPDQYTVVPAPLKILKLLIAELLSAQGPSGAPSLEAGGRAAAAAAAGAGIPDSKGGAAGADAADPDQGADPDPNSPDSDDGWEDEADDLLDLGLGATKHDLFAYLDGVGGAGSRMRDDETQAYLTEFFLRAARENTAHFKDWYDQLTPAEQQKLNELA